MSRPSVCEIERWQAVWMIMHAYSVFSIGVPARSGVRRAWVKQRKTRFIQSCTYLKEKGKENTTRGQRPVISPQDPKHQCFYTKP